MTQEELIVKINNFAKISKKRELSKKEFEEREKLRSLFLKNFKKGFEQRLEKLKVVDLNGKEIKLEKK